MSYENLTKQKLIEMLVNKDNMIELYEKGIREKDDKIKSLEAKVKDLAYNTKDKMDEVATNYEVLLKQEVDKAVATYKHLEEKVEALTTEYQHVGSGILVYDETIEYLLDQQERMLEHNKLLINNFRKQYTEKEGDN